MITADQVIYIDTVFVADPLLAEKDGRFLMLFEALNSQSGHGDIGLTVVDGKN